MSADYSITIDQHRFDLAFDHNDLIAMVETIDQQDHIFIENVCVHPEHQGKGLGRILVERSENLAQSMGYSAVRLLTNKAFQTNLEFYTKLGYLIEKEEKFLGGTTVYFCKRV